MTRKHFIGCATALVAIPLLLAQGTAVRSATDGPDPAQVAELVLANHILINEVVLDAYGHVSVRDARNPNHFFSHGIFQPVWLPPRMFWNTTSAKSIRPGRT